MTSILKVSVFTALIGLTGMANAAQEFDPKKASMTKLKEGVYQYSQFFYNSLVVVSDKGVIVTDPSGEKRAENMRNAIREITDQPVTTVIYSHDHFDHSRGGKIFKDEGAEFIAQEGCGELLNRDLKGKVVKPDLTYQNFTSVLVGNKQVDLLYYGSNDGKCMSVIHMPKDKVLVGVDWHLPRYVNESYRLPEQDYVGTLNTFKRVRSELEFDTVISGHAPISSPELFEENYQFVKALFDAVWEGMQAGMGSDELKANIKLPQFSHWRGYEENLPSHVDRMFYSIWHGN